MYMYNIPSPDKYLYPIITDIRDSKLTVGARTKIADKISINKNLQSYHITYIKLIQRTDQMM